MSNERAGGVWRDGRFWPGQQFPLMKTDSELEEASLLYKSQYMTKSKAWHDLARVVGEGVGQASSCWESLKEAGEFNEYLASTIIDRIMTAAEVFANRPKIADTVPDKARKHVYEYIKARLEKTDDNSAFGLENVYTVWSCYILENWKCLVSTSLPDGMYYEVTFDVDEEEAYIDAYKKFDNVRVAQGEDRIG